jgi:D-arabinose 1-dehydrogenase-like Zn-dependent alcohol dehydrogenase
VRLDVGVKAESACRGSFLQHASLLGSTMGNASEFEAVLKAFDQGLRPVVDQTFPLDRVEDALTRVDSTEQFGKVVLSVDGG